jgi:hypothetical protein
VAVHRLRKRFRKHIEREVVDTVAPEVGEVEMQFLRATLEAGGRRLDLYPQIQSTRNETAHRR